VIGRIVNCFEVGEKEDVPLSNSNSLCGIYASPCFAMDVVTAYGGFVQWRLTIVIHCTTYVFKKLLPYVLKIPLEFTTICEQRFLLWQILDSIHKIFLVKNHPCFNEFSFEIPRFRQ